MFNISFHINKYSCVWYRSVIGRHFNEWRKPIICFGIQDEMVEEFFDDNRLHIERDDWELSCEIVDRVLDVVVGEMVKVANERFPGLIFGGTLKKQGSSRDGLKVCDALEFDLLIPFYIEDIRMVERVVCEGNGSPIPGLKKMEIMNYLKFPSWGARYNLLYRENEKTYINARNLQTRVFTFILDQIKNRFNIRFKRVTKNTYNEYSIVLKPESPNLKITIKVKSKDGLDGFKNLLDSGYNNEDSSDLNEVNLEIDLVPGFLLSTDTYTCYADNDRFVSCERYGVIKWLKEGDLNISSEDGDLIWRNSSCGYEKCIFDIAQKNPDQLYIMTACIVLKGSLRQFEPESTDKLRIVLQSYHLKTLCHYGILFLSILEQESTISSVTEALGYLMEFLRLSLNAENLPHFFHGNPYLDAMFPGSCFGNERNFNMFAKHSPESLDQARLQFSCFAYKLRNLYCEKQLLDRNKIKLFAGLLFV